MTINQTLDLAADLQQPMPSEYVRKGRLGAWISEITEGATIYA